MAQSQGLDIGSGSPAYSMRVGKGVGASSRGADASRPHRHVSSWPGDVVVVAAALRVKL
jgi:hypothetical protein